MRFTNSDINTSLNAPFNPNLPLPATNHDTAFDILEAEQVESPHYPKNDGAPVDEFGKVKKCHLCIKLIGIGRAFIAFAFIAILVLMYTLLAESVVSEFNIHALALNIELIGTTLTSWSGFIASKLIPAILAIITFKFVTG